MQNKVTKGHKNKKSYANKRTTGKEQYYTNPEVVDTCLTEVTKHISLTDRRILEPCGGTGEFIKGLQRLGIPDEKIISFDIEPKHPMVVKQNYLDDDLVLEEGLISITNPPFGRASSLAKKFFNKAANHCDYICYLVPKAWRKWSTWNSIDKRFHLIADIEMPQNCFYLPEEEETKKGVLNTVFQIWEKRKELRRKIVIPDHGLIEKIVPVIENGKKVIKGANFQIIAFGHSCGNTADITAKQVDYVTTTMYLNVPNQETKDAFASIDLSKYYNNVSYVQALSIKEINYELNEYFGLDNFVF